MLGQLRDRISANGRSVDMLGPLTPEHRERRELFTLYWKYYRGKHRKNIVVKAGQADDNVTLNYSKKIVNQGIDFLFGKELFFEIDRSVITRTPSEKYLDTVWADDPINNFSMLDFLQGVAMNGGITGTPFIRLYPAGTMRELPTLININPAMVDVITDPDDMGSVLEYQIIWKSGDNWKRDRFVQEGDGWAIVREISDRSNHWQIEDEALWDYTWAPLFHCQNLKNPLSFWGISDLEDADLNDSINFTASNNHRILRFHAHPRTVVVGTEARNVQTTAVDQLWAIPVDGASVSNLEMQSDLAASREHLSDLKQDFHNISDVPMMDAINTQVGGLSGFALRILYGSLINKTESKRRRYGGMLARINWALLELAGMDTAVTQTRWQDSLPSNATEQAALFETLVRASGNVLASAKTAGYTEEEAEALAERVRILPQDRFIGTGLING